MRELFNQTTSLDSSKLKEFADGNFRFDENGRKLSKRVENTVGKGEIAHYEQFLLFPRCFQMACFPGASKGVIVWEWVNLLIHNADYQTPKKKKIRLKTLWGKRRKCWLPACFPFPPNVFYCFKEKLHHMNHIENIVSKYFNSNILLSNDAGFNIYE